MSHVAEVPVHLALGQLTSHSVSAYRSLLLGLDVESILTQRGLLVGRVKPGPGDPHHAHGDRALLPLAAQDGYESLDRSELEMLWPELDGRVSHARYLPAACFTTYPAALTTSITREFVAAGGRLLQASVVDLDVHGTVVRSVRTTGGDIDAGVVAVCASQWSRRLLRKLRIEAPVVVERGYGVDIPHPGLSLRLPLILDDVQVGFFPHRTGPRLAGRSDLTRVVGWPNHRVTNSMLRVARHVFPALEHRGAEPWIRLRPATPDSLPVIGASHALHNAFLAFGHGHKALATGAITAQLIGELIEGRPPSVDLTPFDPMRFLDHTRRE
jgi:D-amino-acid dehydrogenase